MFRVKGRSQGFTLVASLLVLVLLSAIAVSLLFMVQGAGQVGSNDLENNQAYYGAESGMELLTANLAALYQQSQAPTPAQLNNLTNSPPTTSMIGNMAYQESITWTPDANGNPVSHTSVISAGSNAGLTAEIIPLTLNVSAVRPSGAAVNMTRGVEVSLIPVFQFGVFSDSDLSYFAGPDFDFQGRVHTNGNLFLAEGGGSLVLDDKVSAVKQIVRDRLANNYPGNVNYTGGVYVLNKGGGCDGTVAQAIVKANCKVFPVANASWNGGIPIGAGAANNNPSPNDWSTVSNTYFNQFVATGVAPLTLPFVQGATSSKDQIQIIRKTIDPAELPGSALGSSREYTKANIRVLLASSQADLHPERGAIGDGQDVDLENRAVGGACPPATGYPVAVAGGTTTFAMATANAMPNTGAKDLSWVKPTAPANGSACDPWSLVDGWLRVEYRNTAGVWTGITKEWLARGFARGIAPPTAPQTNGVHQNAILIFQEPADRDGSGTITAAKDAPLNTFDGVPANLNTNSRFSWYPINFYDPREGFPRDVAPAGMANPSCYVNGIMNAVEIDVGNLQKWIQGVGGGASGPLVENTSQNGYLLFFSDRRGMVPDPNATPVPGVTTGEYGFEDVINRASATGTPDNALEGATYYAFSPEDVDQNGLKDNWGAQPVGWGFGLGAAATTNNPYQSVNCMTVGRQNAVTGARHVLRLIDGGLNNLPYPGAASWGVGGFTVASENPVYIWGNYNSDNTDPFWGNPTIGTPTITNDINHSAASVIADSVTLLSNGWSDLNDMNNTLNLGNRVPTTTYYRLAIAGGKNINFPQPTNCAAACNDFGTDGGVHNFLRYLENWGGVTLSYRGSLVSLYYSQYNTGTFKCCNLVYGAPNRNYYFDSAFLNPTKLPPGTPMLQDVVNLTYWQNFKPY